MGCADYCVDCDGDTDGNGNDLLHGVLDKKSVLEIFPERFELIDEINILFLKNDAFCAKVLVKTHRLHSPSLPL